MGNSSIAPAGIGGGTGETHESTITSMLVRRRRDHNRQEAQHAEGSAFGEALVLSIQRRDDMNEQFADVAGVRICYETFGDPSGFPLLLIMGLGDQMIGWDEQFCRRLVDRGFFVIRYDNRDCGRSARMSGRGITTLGLVTGRIRHPPYRLADMAADAAGLLEHLSLNAAHVVGISMGGMIAQHVAFDHPGRVLSLVSMMATTGGHPLAQFKLTALPSLLKPAPTGSKDAYVEFCARQYRAFGTHLDEDAIRQYAAASWDRGIDQEATGRQFAALAADGNRKKRLAGIRASTLVIHGLNDELIAPSHGHATAKAIPGAQLLTLDGLGHDLPRPLWPKIIDAIADNACRASNL